MNYRTKAIDDLTYLSNADLPFVPGEHHGNIVIGKEFTNTNRKERIPLSNLFKWQTTPNPQRKEKKQETFRHPMVGNADLFDAEEDMIAFLGHATFFIRLNGINFITDPVLGTLPLMKRYSGLPFEKAAIRNIDHMLLSHGHMDHFDNASIKLLAKNNPKASLLGPLQVGKLVKPLGNIEFQEAAWFQQFLSDDVEITYLPAQHWHRRGLNDYNTVLWGSFWLRSNGVNIYFAGDSGYNNHYQHIRAVMGPADICIMPVGAYSPTFMMQHAHMSPQEAVKAFHDLEGKVLIPMHYGTFDLADEPIGEPYRILSKMATDGQINGKLILPAIGEALWIKSMC